MTELTEDLLKQLLEEKNYDAIWEQITPIGFLAVPNMDTRYTYFCKFISKYEYKGQSINDFAMEYKKALQRMKAEDSII